MATNSPQTALVKFETDSGEVALSPQIIRQYLVNGQGNVTDQEVMMFLRLCQYQRLNPFLREAYLIKFGNETATMVTGKEVFTKRAAKDQTCTGWEAGVVAVDKSGALAERPGSLLLPGDELVGGWAKVYRRGWSVPVHNTVALQEYIRVKADGKPQRNWATMPATMIRKVALVQALREAFPESFQGLYSAEEMPVDSAALPTQPVQPPPVHPAPAAATPPAAATTPAASALAQPAQDPEVMASDAQLRAIMELAKHCGLSAADMTQLIRERYSKPNSRMLTVAQADDLAEHLYGIGSAAASAAATEDKPESGLFKGEPQC